MTIAFYQATSMSSAAPVAWALAELGVPHETIKLDLASGAQKQPDFLRLNPNGKVPTVVVDGVAGFEALAIMMWLGERYGVDKGLWPAANDPQRLPAMAWSAWAYVSYGAKLGQMFLASSPRVDAALRNAAQAEHVRKELDDMLRILDGQLAATGYVVGKQFSLADLIVAGAVAYGSMSGVPVDAYAHVKSWLAQCTARPAFRANFG